MHACMHLSRVRGAPVHFAMVIIKTSPGMYLPPIAVGEIDEEAEEARKSFFKREWEKKKREEKEGRTRRKEERSRGGAARRWNK